MERPHNNISVDTGRDETCDNNNKYNTGEKDKIQYHNNRPGNHKNKNNTTEKAKSHYHNKSGNSNNKNTYSNQAKIRNFKVINYDYFV